MKIKKKGSAFVIVVIFMSAILTVGTSVLTLTSSNYKVRINESERLENLYEADSGLDIVKNIIIKTAQEAIKYADKEVKKSLINSDIKEKEEIDNIFKNKFYEFLLFKDVEGGKEVEILKYLILNKQVITSINDDGSINIESLKDVAEDKNYIIEIPDNGYRVNKKENEIESITIDVKSTFKSGDEEFKNKRTVSTTFEIKAPEYESKVSIVDIYPVFDGKAITADGDMTVNGEGDSAELSIEGDIWIKGEDINLSNNPNFTFDKYKNGLKLSKTKFCINGNIYTSNTFSLNNEVKDGSVVEGKIYAKNIYVGKELYSTVSSNNNMIFRNNVIVNNDLAMDTTNSNVIIEKNFYGISDKTSDVSTANKALNSSSIIINGSEQSRLTVKKDSYILGVAYLNATDSKGEKYQTGESVAVKGNYLAYTDVQDVLDGNTDVTLKYYSPLQLLESINGNNDANMKADYFVEYYSDSKKRYQYKDGGVNLEGKVFSAGATVKDSYGKIQKTLVDMNSMQLVNSEREEYARNVFAMGDTTNLGENIYENQVVLRTVENQIDFSKIEDFKLKESESGVLVLNNNENLEITIEDNTLNGKTIKEGLIITNGNVKIRGNFNFTGTIITAGNIIFEGTGKKIINYNAEVVRGIIAANYDLVKDIFNKESSKGEEIKISSSSEMYNSDKFLKQSLWKIER